MSPARNLYDLQQAEQAIHQRRRALAEMEERLRGNPALEDARARAAEAAQALARLQREQRALELEVLGLASHAADLEKRLYAGAGATPKELVGIQGDIASIQRRRSALEDRLLDLMLLADEAASALRQAQAALAEEEARWAEESGRLQREALALQGELAALEERRSAAEKALAPQERATYHGLRASRGTPVARVERGICGGCGISLPSHQLQRARASQEMVLCSSCGRVLYVS